MSDRDHMTDAEIIAWVDQYDPLIRSLVRRHPWVRRRPDVFDDVHCDMRSEIAISLRRWRRSGGACLVTWVRRYLSVRLARIVYRHCRWAVSPRSRASGAGRVRGHVPLSDVCGGGSGDTDRPGDPALCSSDPDPSAAELGGIWAVIRPILSATQWDILRRYYVLGQDTTQIARDRGVSRNGAHAPLAEARRRIRELLPHLADLL